MRSCLHGEALRPSLYDSPTSPGSAAGAGKRTAYRSGYIDGLAKQRCRCRILRSIYIAKSVFGLHTVYPATLLLKTIRRTLLCSPKWFPPSVEHARTPKPPAKCGDGTDTMYLLSRLSSRAMRRGIWRRSALTRSKASKKQERVKRLVPYLLAPCMPTFAYCLHHQLDRTGLCHHWFLRRW